MSEQKSPTNTRCACVYVFRGVDFAVSFLLLCVGVGVRACLFQVREKACFDVRGSRQQPQYCRASR